MSYKLFENEMQDIEESAIQCIDLDDTDDEQNKHIGDFEYIISFMNEYDIMDRALKFRFMLVAMHAISNMAQISCSTDQQREALARHCRDIIDTIIKR